MLKVDNKHCREGEERRRREGGRGRREGGEREEKEERDRKREEEMKLLTALDVGIAILWFIVCCNARLH